MVRVFACLNPQLAKVFDLLDILEIPHVTTFVCPSVCGWNVVNLFNLVSIFYQSVVQKALRKLVSMFTMMLLGIPKCTQTHSKNVFASFFL
jgi:hypothetical protein